MNVAEWKEILPDPQTRLAMVKKHNLTHPQAASPADSSFNGVAYAANIVYEVIWSSTYLFCIEQVSAIAEGVSPSVKSEEFFLISSFGGREKGKRKM